MKGIKGVVKNNYKGGGSKRSVVAGVAGMIEQNGVYFFCPSLGADLRRKLYVCMCLRKNILLSMRKTSLKMS